MKLCIIFPPGYFPYPIRSGGSTGSYYIIDALRDKIDITIIFTYKKKDAHHVEEIKRIWDDVELIGFLDDKWMRFIGSMFRGMPSFNESYMCFFNKIIQENRFDIVQTEFYPSLHYIYSLNPAVKTVFIHHEIRYIRNERGHKGNRSLIDEYNLKKGKQEELTALNQYSSVVALSEIDRNILANDGVRVPIYNSPSLVSSQNTFKEEYRFSNKIVFLATGAHQPNREGLIWFMDKIWDKVFERCPLVEFHVIGKWNRKIVRKYKTARFLGFIKDFSTALEGAIMVVPILTGSGIRIKILDGINCGCPIVSTSVGIEGLEFQNDVDCIIEDDEMLFVERLCSLIKNEEKQKQLRINAKRTLDRQYSSEDLINKRLKVYYDILELNVAAMSSSPEE